MTDRHSRRRMLALSGAVSVAVIAGCNDEPEEEPAGEEDPMEEEEEEPAEEDVEEDADEGEEGVEDEDDEDT